MDIITKWHFQNSNKRDLFLMFVLLINITDHTILVTQERPDDAKLWTPKTPMVIYCEYHKHIETPKNHNFDHLTGFSFKLVHGLYYLKGIINSTDRVLFFSPAYY